MLLFALFRITIDIVATLAALFNSKAFIFPLTIATTIAVYLQS